MSANNCPECGGILTDPDHDHTQVPVSAEGHHAHVDEGMAELVGVCWSIGIITRHSCQEDPDLGLACLSFGSGSAERFIGAATDEDLDDPATFDGLGWRMRGTESPESWRWQPSGFPWGVFFGAYFPPSDIPGVVHRLARWL